jgi:hypothetical protein
VWVGAHIIHTVALHDAQSGRDGTLRGRFFVSAVMTSGNFEQSSKIAKSFAEQAIRWICSKHAA